MRGDEGVEVGVHATQYRSSPGSSHFEGLMFPGFSQDIQAKLSPAV